MRKLHDFGVTSRSLALLQSYLRGRIQRVDVIGERTLESTVNMDVPQSSVLGPLLFLVYTNDLPHLDKDRHGILLLSDDTSLLFKINGHQPAYNEVNSTISEVVEWFGINNLLFNEKKTKLVKFSFTNAKPVDENVMINNEILDIVDTTIFLGVTLDAKLRWNSHITRLVKRLSAAAYTVKRIRRLTDESTGRLVYFRFLHSLTNYEILLRGAAANISPIFVLQKRAIHAVYDLRPMASLRKKLKKLIS
ncbi:Probable RNA-directed DNA polymerase from transposon BS [Eumeta japonica]|uniref:Probable RNA-directed DNA polymerase from transposon BS n=1 Tax=Eumeta variegata TaxID=151549 RepID=A0A4C1XH50_EUMVA|nr:Probable RNA-directed DNA polymerase from transposon BS [Eumeta japonica]